MSMIDDPMIAALGRFLDVNVARLRLIDANLANVDTPGFQARDLDFRPSSARQAVEGDEAGRLSYASSFSSSTSSLPYTPVARPVRGLLQRPDGNNVSVERESLLLAETQMKYSLGVQLLKDEFHGISQAINSGGTSS
jgi:flagellar basal-body rod protein FlgB